ncbi:glutathione peroxidase [Phocicoccus pinnipedialis]|uniref:Glutathione peroxidase n=1 Tax=Phocicoccus pinnipedialis TaxID=110845 RepID=A0A6V7R5T2_9BACL|nr:glutathione peroxidase [Jeotgalicoccus pinnipedialis]MBP1939753.1 glutathione peroxidase [Jeotgalicoccus pinnipedialis]CAD2072375.1 Glutathione peroxidase BsaA [Jeotgalicoccus pinnipedialis]
MTQNIYDIEVKDKTGNYDSLEKYKGQVMVVVNTATQCGLSGQFNTLEELYQKYKDDGFVVLGFPSNQFANQEPGDDEEIAQTCQMNFGVTFPIYSKVDVNGKNESPLFTYLKKESKGMLGSSIKWNFTKFLIDQEGNVVQRYGPKDSPLKMEEQIKSLLSKNLK